MAEKPTYEELEQRVKELEAAESVHKQAEEAHQKSEAKYRDLYDNTPDMHVSVDSKTATIIECNQTILNELGYERKEVIGRSIFDMYTPDSAEYAKTNVFPTFVKTGSIEGEELQLKRKNGTSMEVSLNVSSVFDGNGNVLHSRSVWRDITERKQAEDALRKAHDELEHRVKERTAELIKVTDTLRESVEKFKTVADFTYDWEYWIRPDGNHVYVSPSCKRITGYGPDDFINNPGLMIEIIHPDDMAMFTKHKHIVDELGEIAPIDFRIITKDGDERWIEQVCQVVYDTDGQYLGQRGSNRDITEQKKLQEEVLKAHKMEAIGKLAGGIAHQFNNALYTITGNIDLLEMDFPGDKNVANYAKQMADSAQRMAQLTAQLLAYAKGGQYQAKTISLSDFVRKTLPLAQSFIDSAIHVDADLPRDTLNVKVDLAQMQMVLSDVLSNASEAMEGQGRIRVALQKFAIADDATADFPGFKPGNYACLIVTDDGKGMDEETRTRIFEPFFSTKFEGRGLGMAAAHGIVKNHGGWISVDSELDKGTTVKIYLPAVEASVKEDVKIRQKPAEWVKGTGTILVIDDEKAVVTVCRAMLERMGYHVLEARSGQEAIDVIKTFDGDIELAMLDILMPGMSGEAIYPLLMKARPDLKVLVFSGYSVEGPVRKILDAGAQDFIQKPFTMADLSQKLKKVIESE